MIRGLKLEPFHVQLLRWLYGNEYVVTTDCGSRLHRKHKYIMTTDDAHIREPSDPVTKKLGKVSKKASCFYHLLTKKSKKARARCRVQKSLEPPRLSRDA
jgi:hypothetical protein